MQKLKILFLFLLCIFATYHSYADEQLPRIQFELIDNRIFVDVYINDKGPFKFIFDTGGNNSMTFDLAKRLGLPVQGSGNGTGGGRGSQTVGKTKVRKFQIAGIDSIDQDFWVIDYSKIQKSFNLDALDGIFGYEILEKYLTYIDFENSYLSFFSRSSDFNARGFDIINFTLEYEKPFLKTKINGFDANTLVDTGDRSALTVTKIFRKRSSINNAFKEKPEVISGYGVGGIIPAKISTLVSLAITNKAQIKDVASRAPTAKGGFNSIIGLDASIGNEVLKQFNLGFDYRNKILYLQKNKNYGQKTKFVPVPNPQ